MTAAAHALLASVTKALSADPFAGWVKIEGWGRSIRRDTARELERNLSRLKGTNHA